jgi:hypothetical protein
MGEGMTVRWSRRWCLMAMAVAAAAWPRRGFSAPPLVPITNKDVDQLLKFWQSALAVLKADRSLVKRLQDRPGASEREDEPRLVTAVLGEPKLKRLLNEAGIKPERFEPVMSSFVAGEFAIQMKRSGQMKEYPAELKQSAQLLEHRRADAEKLNAIFRELEAMDKSSARDDDER